MGGHGFYHQGTEDGQNQYDWFLKVIFNQSQHFLKYFQNYVPPKQWPDAINTTKNNNKQPDFKPYGIMWGCDIWNLYGTEGLVKRTPTVTRQQRRRARQQVDMVSHKNHKILLYSTLKILGSILKSLCSPRNGSFKM